MNRDWSRDVIPADVIDREAARLNGVLSSAGCLSPSNTLRSSQSPQIAVAVLKSLIDECNKNNIEHLSVATLEAALERWIK